MLALITAHRAQTISKIKISNIVCKTDSLEIKIPDAIKTSGPGRYQPLLIIPKNVNNPTSCVAKCILEYISNTKEIRGDEEKLFISVRKPFKVISSQTVSKWIKQVLFKSGVDVSVFSAHSTRHASTSAALAKGVDISTIRSTANWSENSKVFANFYNRPITRSREEFARAILDN